MTHAERDRPSSCFVCAEQAGEVEVPGGVLDDGPVLTFHVPPPDGVNPVYAGHLLVTAQRHAPDFAALDASEAGEVGVAIAKYSHALKQLGAQHVYVATIGHRVSHLHVHLLPRWPETPADVPWHQIDEWAGARRVAAAGIAQLMDHLRELTR